MSNGPFGNPAHQWDYYFKCMVGGILSCGLTHAAVVPLDVVKCRMQVSKYRYSTESAAKKNFTVICSVIIFILLSTIL